MDENCKIGLIFFHVSTHGAIHFYTKCVFPHERYPRKIWYGRYFEHFNYLIGPDIEVGVPFMTKHSISKCTEARLC